VTPATRAARHIAAPSQKSNRGILMSVRAPRQRSAQHPNPTSEDEIMELRFDLMSNEIDSAAEIRPAWII
jgi:hypothetical protein